MKTKIRPDVIVIAFIVIILIISFVLSSLYRSNRKSDYTVAIIKFDNQIVREIVLDEVKDSYEFEIKGEYTNKIRVEKGRIRFLESNCPHKICVDTGWLSEPGEIAVCLPNKSIIEIKGSEYIIDGISR